MKPDFRHEDTTQAQLLVDRSVSHNEIVHAPFAEPLAAILAAWADDWTRTEEVLEYWGTDDETGNEWRVHLDR